MVCRGGPVGVKVAATLAAEYMSMQPATAGRWSRVISRVQGVGLRVSGLGCQIGCWQLQQRRACQTPALALGPKPTATYQAHHPWPLAPATRDRVARAGYHSSSPPTLLPLSAATSRVPSPSPSPPPSPPFPTASPNSAPSSLPDPSSSLSSLSNKSPGAGPLCDSLLFGGKTKRRRASTGVASSRLMISAMGAPDCTHSCWCDCKACGRMLASTHAYTSQKHTQLPRSTSGAHARTNTTSSDAHTNDAHAPATRLSACPGSHSPSYDARAL